MLKVFECFSGIGSQTTALKRLKILHKIVAISEIDKFALKSYEAIHGHCPNLGHVSKIAINDIPNHDLFTYSFPCQDISEAGNQKGFSINDNTRSGLLWECKKIISHVKPKFLIMENVKAIVNTKNINNLRLFISWLSDMGYKNYYKVLNAKDYGIPQNRKRFFCVSIRKDVNVNFRFPSKQILKSRIRDFIDINNTNRKFFKNKQKEYFFKLKECDLNYKFKNSLFDNINLNNKIIKLCDMSKIFNTGFFGFSSKNIYSIDGICPTLTTFPNEHQFYELKGGLSAIECFRLMGFNDEEFYKASKVCSDLQLIKQAGNSIVVNVLSATFKSLFIDLKEMSN